MGVEGVHIFRAARLPARSWTWRGFTSSARHDSAEFHHWVRANVEYADYPYARFDVSLNPLVYTDEEYARYFETTDVSELMGGEWDLVADRFRRRGERINGRAGLIDRRIRSRARLVDCQGRICISGVWLNFKLAAFWVIDQLRNWPGRGGEGWGGWGQYRKHMLTSNA
jgi:hypothetical protein